jgi:hypothetical protein
MAFTLACRAAGVPVVDVQHGLQGDHHIAYGRWVKVPQTGYSLLPNWFWCWSEGDAEAVRTWAAVTGEAHRAIGGGNPWLEEWTYGDPKLVGPSDTAVQSIKKRLGASQRHLLVTLQWGLSEAETAKLISAMRLAPSDWTWWVRVHPYALAEREKIRSALRDGGVTACEIDLATDLPLHGLLRHMDVHLTHSSSTVIEARFFAVPSVVTSEYGLEFFRQEACAGWIEPGLDPSGIVRAVNTLLARKAGLIRTGLPQPQMESALRTLLKGDGSVEESGSLCKSQGGHLEDGGTR